MMIEKKLREAMTQEGVDTDKLDKAVKLARLATTLEMTKELFIHHGGSKSFIELVPRAEKYVREMLAYQQEDESGE